MSYLALARKWRPKTFDAMVGQEHIARTLRNAIESGRIAHAFLFTGTRGVGKTTAARVLAKALNCARGPTPTPCGECENCQEVDRGSSMDVLEIDGASNNGVENVRELREQVKYAPMRGTYKVYIIDEVHMLSKSAFNALLKTLEEPPPHVVFIFATTEVSKVPHTILSRVQRFDFRRISEAAIRERLEYICREEGIRAEPEALEAVARKADGSLRDALSLFDRVRAFAGEAFTLEAARKSLGIPADGLFDDLLRALAGQDRAAALAVLNAVYDEGIEVGEFLLGFGEFLRDLLFSRQEGMTPGVLGLGEARFRELRALAGDLQDGDFIRYAKIVSDLLGGLRTAPHPRLWVEMGLARMAALDRVVALSQLLGAATPAAPAPGSDSEAAKKKSPLNGTLHDHAVPPASPVLAAAPEPPPSREEASASPGFPDSQEPRISNGPPVSAGPPEPDPRPDPVVSSLDPGPEPPPEDAAPGGIPPGGGTDWLEREPIVKTLLELFEGRVLDPHP